MVEDRSMFAGVMDPGAAVVASELAAQLGTDKLDLALGRFDMRRLTVIERKHLKLVLYATIKERKSRVWGALIDVLKNWGVSVDGRGRRDIIRMEAVSRGGLASVESEITRPGWAARNVYDRAWAERQRREKGL